METKTRHDAPGHERSSCAHCLRAENAELRAALEWALDIMPITAIQGAKHNAGYKQARAALAKGA